MVGRLCWSHEDTFRLYLVGRLDAFQAGLRFAKSLEVSSFPGDPLQARLPKFWKFRKPSHFQESFLVVLHKKPSADPFTCALRVHTGSAQE
jgi:hypothetical protein